MQYELFCSCNVYVVYTFVWLLRSSFCGSISVVWSMMSYPFTASWRLAVWTSGYVVWAIYALIIISKIIWSSDSKDSNHLCSNSVFSIIHLLVPKGESFHVSSAVSSRKSIFIVKTSLFQIQPKECRPKTRYDCNVLWGDSVGSGI